MNESTGTGAQRIVSAGTQSGAPALDPTQMAVPGAADLPIARAGGDPLTLPATAPSKSSFNWFRFWTQMLAAMIAFNVVAGLITWYYIFPRLHPAH
jgi:hypothetical protein